jgi:hypothetical protein
VVPAARRATMPIAIITFFILSHLLSIHPACAGLDASNLLEHFEERVKKK